MLKCSAIRGEVTIPAVSPRGLLIREDEHLTPLWVDLHFARVCVTVCICPAIAAWIAALQLLIATLLCLYSFIHCILEQEQAVEMFFDVTEQNTTEPFVFFSSEIHGVRWTSLAVL